MYVMSAPSAQSYTGQHPGNALVTLYWSSKSVQSGVFSTSITGPQSVTSSASLMDSFPDFDAETG